MVNREAGGSLMGRGPSLPQGLAALSLLRAAKFYEEILQ